jgi:hypothetical protein
LYSVCSFALRMGLGFTMLCDVISAVTEFVVRCCSSGWYWDSRCCWAQRLARHVCDLIARFSSGARSLMGSPIEGRSLMGSAVNYTPPNTEGLGNILSFRKCTRCCRSDQSISCLRPTYAYTVRCAFSDRILHSRMPLDPTHVRLKQT